MPNSSQVSTLKVNEVIDELQAFLVYLFSKWKSFSICILLGLLVAFIYSFFQQPKFEAKASFILEEKSGTVGGGLSGLASQFGFDIGSLTGSNGLFAGDNILDILKSRTIIEKVLLTRVDSSFTNSGKTAINTTLADLFLTCSNLKDKWSSNPRLREINFSSSKNDAGYLRLQDSILLVFYQKLIKHHIQVERVNKKGSIFQITTTTSNEIFSKLFTERLVLETIRMYVDLKTSVATKNIIRLESRSDSLMKLLNATSYKSASLQVLDANAAYKATAVPVEVSQRDKSVTYALYAEVMKNLEASRMSLSNQTPIINMLDQAKYPLENQEKKLWVLLLIGALVGFSIAFLINFFNYR